MVLSLSRQLVARSTAVLVRLEQVLVVPELDQLLGIAACLAFLGILTTSTLAGLKTRRPRTAFRALFLQMGALAGGVSGAGCAWLVTLTDLTEMQLRPALLIGGAAGLLFGLAISFLFNRLWGTVLDRLIRRCGTPGKSHGEREA